MCPEMHIVRGCHPDQRSGGARVEIDDRYLAIRSAQSYLADSEADRSPAGQNFRESVVSPASVVTCAISPPTSEMRIRPFPTFVAKTIEPSSPQLAPFPTPSIAVIVTGGPPFADTRLIAAPSKNPIDSPSGEKKHRPRDPRTVDAHRFQPIERADIQHEPALFEVQNATRDPSRETAMSGSADW